MTKGRSNGNRKIVEGQVVSAILVRRVKDDSRMTRRLHGERLHRWIKGCTPELRVSHIFANVRRTKSFWPTPLFPTRKLCSVTVLVRNTRGKTFSMKSNVDQSTRAPMYIFSLR